MPRHPPRSVLRDVWDTAAQYHSRTHRRAIKKTEAIENKGDRRRENNRISAAQHRDILNRYISLVSDELREAREVIDDLMAKMESRETSPTQSPMSVADSDSATPGTPQAPPMSPVEQDEEFVHSLHHHQPLALPSPTDDWPYGVDSQSEDSCFVSGTPLTSESGDDSMMRDWFSDQQL